MMTRKNIEMQKMDWYSQPTGMGTFTSEGTEKLLGTPGIETLELLVRESAQNSWDAALDGSIPTFGVDYRHLSTEQRHLIAETIFREGRQHTLLPDSLKKRDLDVLEIWDRGTTGLNGPVRADLTIPDKVPTNFIDLIYMIGSSNKKQDAGGNYGFGKSSAFKSSEAKAIVYWTVCRNELGILEHRFIASAVSSEFDIDGRSYVGRHWWGQRIEDPTSGEARLEPLVGVEAQELGEALFARKFVGDETGTSILIVDPDELAIIGNISEEEILPAEIFNSAEEQMTKVNKRLTDVVMKHLWPKLVTSNDRRRMRIFVNKIEITQDMGQRYPYVGSYVACLDAVRNKHDGIESSLLQPNIEVIPIVVGRGREVVGHLALTNGINAATMMGDVSGEILDTDIPKNSVALMRDGAELIVKYVSGIQEHPKEVLYWTGVFKPCPKFDPDFASAEPSSHDDWVVGSLQGVSKTRVKISLQRIEEGVRGFLGSNEPVRAPAGAGSVSALALELGRLISVIADGAEGETEPESGGNGTGGSDGESEGGKKRKKTGSRNGVQDRSVLVSEITLEATLDQRNVHRVEVKFFGDWTKDQKFSVKPKVRIEGNAKSAGADDKFEFSWPSVLIEDEDSVKANGERILTMANVLEEAVFDVYSPGHFSFDLDVEPN